MQDLSQFFVSASSYCNTDECLRGITLSQAYARASRYGLYQSTDEGLPGDMEVKNELSRLSV